MRLIKSTPKGKQRVYDIEVADVHNFYANGVNVHNCATAGGVSVIKDDGTVVDITWSSYGIASSVYFKDNYLWLTNDSGIFNKGGRYLKKYSIPSSDISESHGYLRNSALKYWASPWGFLGAYTGTSYPPLLGSYSGFYGPAVGPYLGGSDGTNGGITFIGDEGTTTTNGLVAYATTSYNTGWMHGDIKGAFLADTDDTDVTGTTVYTETFTDNNNGWGTVDATISGGILTLAAASASRATDYDALTNIPTGTKLAMTFTTTVSGGANFIIDDDGNGAGLGTVTVYSPSYSSNGTYSFMFTKSASPRIRIINTTANGPITIDNITIKPIQEEDRSVNNNGLQVFGTVTKSAVATGAELVAYSGFSANNHLLQSNITAPGTGDFSLCFWIRPETFGVGTGNYFHLFSLGTTSIGGQGSGTGFVLKMSTTTENPNGYAPYFYSGDGTQDKSTYASENHFKLGVWNHCVAMRKSGIPYFYINGVLIRTGTSWTQNITDTYLTIGRGIGYGEYGGDAKVSLLRYSLSAPSPEQIKKIYEDEKVLFQENAACTLYGSSDAVTALAYDEVTERLHVGTSSGRSDFQGLRRINNTTTAVTTAISAHDEFIVEQ